MAELFFSKFSSSLEIEIIWRTHQWNHRLFATLIGMAVVDALRAYQYKAVDAGLLGSVVVDVNIFISQLAYQLVSKI
ncbi:Hypothetical protein PHPALM_20221 [Phytophthora palmivora]|uniref:Uncharacterized protein n=1 Tax=Phytophthora palmivora TaxID=4796 RepID=A0A2P4XFG1_9STRA|nr:Hypothetical protein PHPALM_20221 [Phytophthora palmivora]